MKEREGKKWIGLRQSWMLNLLPNSQQGDDHPIIDIILAFFLLLDLSIK